ncbi:MAG TPA: AAA family ATPase, partial [Candidatus Dormibacteraeota bacterium]|nr:AAA family ATPase [Candidatus Dormibacteraeota bacterium]
MRPDPEPGGTSAARLVGRCGELLALERAIRSAPSIAVVDGEAGIGKTRLVAEALARVRPAVARQLVGGCEPLSQPVPLGPVVDAIRRAGPVLDPSRLSPLAATLRHVVPELAASLPVWPGPEPPPLDRSIFHRAVAELLGALGPAVLVLEDLQWCDPGTLDFLRCLVAGMPPALALVLTYRGEEVAPGGSLRTITSRCPAGVEPVHIRLGPLTATEVHELAARLVGDASVSPALTARLHARTGGIPFAVEETVRLVDERRAGPGGWDRATADELDAAGVPRGVEDVVRERVARLPADAQRVAEAAATLAVPADIDLLAAVSGVSRSRALLAVRAALLAAVLVEHSDGTYGHRHALATEAVHAAIPRAEREVLHRRAAAALEAEEPRPYLRLARHLRECGSVERWTRAADAAADVALAAWDPATAARLLVEVLPAARVTVRERARMALKAARAAGRGGACRREAAALLRGLLDERALPRALRGEVRHVLGDLLLALGDTAEGRRELRRCVEDLRDHTEMRVHTLATLAVPWVPEGQMDDHLRDARAAVAELPAVADPVQRISVLTMRAQALVCVGDPGARQAVRAIPWRSTEPETQTILMWAAANLIDPWFHLGEYATARAFLRDTARRSEAVRSPMPSCLEAAAVALD